MINFFMLLSIQFYMQLKKHKIENIYINDVKYMESIVNINIKKLGLTQLKICLKFIKYTASGTLIFDIYYSEGCEKKIIIGGTLDGIDNFYGSMDENFYYNDYLRINKKCINFKNENYEKILNKYYRNDEYYYFDFEDKFVRNIWGFMNALYFDNGSYGFYHTYPYETSTIESIFKIANINFNIRWYIKNNKIIFVDYPNKPNEYIKNVNILNIYLTDQNIKNMENICEQNKNKILKEGIIDMIHDLCEHTLNLCEGSNTGITYELKYKNLNMDILGVKFCETEKNKYRIVNINNINVSMGDIDKDCFDVEYIIPKNLIEKIYLILYHHNTKCLINEMFKNFL